MNLTSEFAEPVSPAEGRMLVGRFLAMVLRTPPTAPMLGELAGLLAEMPMAPANPQMSAGTALLAGFARTMCTRPTDEVAAELQRDFVALFEGPGPMQAPPWESVYRTEEQLLFGPSTLQVREAYARWGLSLEHPGREPEDHISYELSFLLFLMEQQGAEAEAAHAAFLQGHLLKWIRPFCTLLEDGAQTTFYQGVGKLLLGWVLAEADALA